MSEDSSSVPFYIQPMGHKRSIQIIRDAKAEIKKMETHRPSTPFSRKSNIITRDSSSSRPSSSVSIRSLKYETAERHPVSSVRLRPLSFEKETQEVSENLKLEPIVTKTTLITRKPFSSPVKQQNGSEFRGFPPITDADQMLQEVENDRAKKSFCSVKTIGDSELCNEFPVVESDYKLASENSSHLAKPEISALPEGLAVESPNTALHYTDISMSNETCTVNELSHELSSLFQRLDRIRKLGKKKNEEETIGIVTKIYKTLKKHKMLEKTFSNRVALLKHLFKLLDSNFPVLSLHIAKTVLKMKITDKNLVNVLRLILKVTKEETVDLNNCDILDSLLETLEDITVANNKEACYYGTLIMKHFIFKKIIDKSIFNQQILTIFFRYLCEFNLMVTASDKSKDQFELLISEVVTVLHYLADEESNWETFIKEENLSEILKALYHFTSFKEIVQIIVRLVSKIAAKDGGCDALALSHENIPIMLSPLLEAHKYELDIILQLAFIVGNLVSLDDKQALDFLMCHEFQDTLLSVFEEYVQLHTQCANRSVFNIVKNKYLTSGDQDWKHVVLDVILKSLRIWANICLSPKAGYFLANDKTYVTHLLSVVGTYMIQELIPDDYYLVIGSVLVVLGNITYYLSLDSKEMAIQIAESVIPLLDGNHVFELRLEAASIVRNLTRSPDVRIYIREHSLYPAFIQLLNENEKEFTIVAYGIIMNILIDHTACQSFYKEEGVSRVIHRLHLCSDRDWKISALLCQILWNYCGGKNANQIPLTKMEVQHLIKFLSYSIGEKKTTVSDENVSENQHSWKVEFCSVAEKLLDLLRTKEVALS